MMDRDEFMQMMNDPGVVDEIVFFIETEMTHNESFRTKVYDALEAENERRYGEKLYVPVYERIVKTIDTDYAINETIKDKIIGFLLNDHSIQDSLVEGMKQSVKRSKGVY